MAYANTRLLLDDAAALLHAFPRPQKLASLLEYNAVAVGVIGDNGVAEYHIQAGGIYRDGDYLHILHGKGKLVVLSRKAIKQRLLLQYHYILNNPDEPSVGEDMLAYYNFEEAEDAGWSTAVSYELLLVHDLDDGTVCYLVRENG